MVVTAKTTAEMKALGHRFERVAIHLRSCNLPSMISIRIRRLYLRLSYPTASDREVYGTLENGVPDVLLFVSPPVTVAHFVT